LIKKILDSKFKKDLSISYVSQGITILSSFIQLFLINKYFNVETYGQLTIIIATVGIFSALLTARSSEAITRFFTREMLNNNLENAKFIIFIGFFIDIMTAFLMLLLIYAISEFIAITFIKDVKFSSEVFLYSFIIFFTFLRGTLFGYFQSKEMFNTINIVNILDALLKISILYLVILFIPNSSLYDIILTLLISYIISYSYAFIMFYKNYQVSFKNIVYSYNKNILKEYWNFNIKTFLSSSLKAGNQNIDTILIGYFFNTHTVGIYQTIKKILSPIHIAITPFSMLIYTKLIKFFEEKEFKRFKNLIFKISSYIFIFAIFYTLIGYLLFEDILLLMNIQILDNMYNLYLLLSILTIITSVLWWTRIFSNVVNPNYSLYMNIFATIYQLTVTIIITYLFGINSLIYSIIFMNISIGIYNYLKLKKETNG
jgi:O-antigen/teichoic acid export membrane protein